jgi:hypothetical protein
VPFTVRASISTRLQVETIIASSTPGYDARHFTASGSRASEMANCSRTSSGAVWWFTPMRTKFMKR